VYVWTDPAGYGVCKNCGWPRERHGGKLTSDPCPVRREPLTTSQHLLWLVVTVFTFGVGGILWAGKAARGNQVSTWRRSRRPAGSPDAHWRPCRAGSTRN
jgi:hypothetical protein